MPNLSGCGNRYCIYWLDGSCVLPQVALDDWGVWSECVHVHLPDSELERRRREALASLENS